MKTNSIIPVMTKNVVYATPEQNLLDIKHIYEKKKWHHHIPIVENEKTWRFHPEKKWNSNSIELLIDANLEDVAGNNFKDLLDHSIETKIKKVNTIKYTVELKPKP